MAPFDPFSPGDPGGPYKVYIYGFSNAKKYIFKIGKVSIKDGVQASNSVLALK